MISRRGEVPFVAIRVGRSNDPREVLGLAQELRISRAEALGYVALWEEMLLELGDAMTGRLPNGYTAAHISAKLGWSGKPARLIAALRTAGILTTQRTIFLHPYWKTSTTGAYARDRAEQREHWRLKKQQQRHGDVLEMSRGQVGDVHPMSSETPDIKKEIKGGAPPPQPPTDGGGSLAASRWEWLRQNHRRPMNTGRCLPYLAAMSDEDWALVQWLTGLPPGGGPYKLSRKKRVLELDTHTLLSKQAYLQLLPEWRRKLEEDARPKAPPGARPVLAPVDDGAKVAAQKAAAISFVLAQLMDDDLSEAAKSAARARFVKAHPDIPPPWETGGAGAGELPAPAGTH